MTSLLTLQGNTKLDKTNKLNDGYNTGIIHMISADKSGRNVCKHYSEGCKLVCIDIQGRGVFKNVIKARLFRTNLFFDDLDGFKARLVFEIGKAYSKTIKQGLKLAIRLNGTSDIPYERVFPELFDMFGPDKLTAYDYTKYPYKERPIENLPVNYDLTFSRSETNGVDFLESLHYGRRATMVIKAKKYEALPTKWGPYRIIDGDKNDKMFQYPGSVVIGLRAKGTAMHDTTGFALWPHELPQNYLDTLAAHERKI